MADVEPLPGVPACGLGESPFWHPDERALLWIDIPGRTLHEWRPADGRHRHWALDSDPGCCAPMPGGGLLLATRDGLWRFDRERGERTRLAPPPYDVAQQRFNDGKADPQGRLWVSTLHEPRDRAAAALYRYQRGRFDRMVDGLTVGNGLAFAPDGRTLYVSDTQAHVIRAYDFDGGDGSLSRPRDLVVFARKPADGSLRGYAGRPDGAAMDREGCLWVAMFEGQQLLRLGPDGAVRAAWPLPVRCATMPCFGDGDLRTLYVTTARAGRPADELAAQPWAGHVLRLRVDVPGLPVNFAAP